jgi:hypothetical protein
LATARWTAAGTIGASQTEAAEGRLAKTGMPATVVMLSTVIALAGPPIAAEMPLTIRMPTNHDFSKKLKSDIPIFFLSLIAIGISEFYRKHPFLVLSIFPAYSNLRAMYII